MVDGIRHFEVIDADCVGCNLCVNVCPVDGCITMQPLPVGALDARTGRTVSGDNANWTTHPNNPAAAAAECRRRVPDRAARGRDEEPKTCYPIPAVADAPRTAGTHGRLPFKIGGASGRARVCQYVWTSMAGA